jgi:DNA-directed RNA polymerase subunit RPC12/RpoP
MLPKGRDLMLTEPRTYATLEARCPGCGDSYAGESLLFLYADELGARCPGCGSVLAVGNAGDWRGADRNPCHLVLPEDLEGSRLHQMLAEITAGGEELRVVVDRAGEARTIRLEPAASPEQS